MKFYKHYKNKPYTYLGVARHSETLEEMALYETRYANDHGKLWVRPKGMFFESVTIDGKTVPRFKEIPLEIKAFTKVSATEIDIIAGLMEKAFGQWDEKWFLGTFKNHTDYYLQIGYVEEQPVAFKLGYKMNDREFYSWLGGVVPEFRGLGIASDLMKAQHDWARVQGYKRLQTKTQNRFREMLLLNIRCGFNIVGYHSSDEGGAKIVLEKEL